MGDGPMWQLTTQPLIDSCSKYWYTNLLYFNNLYPVTMQEEVRCINFFHKTTNSLICRRLCTGYSFVYQTKRQFISKLVNCGIIQVTEYRYRTSVGG